MTRDLTPKEAAQMLHAVNKAADRPHVIRYVATYVNADGMRTLMRPAQGRNTWATAEEAQAWIDAVCNVNTASTLADVYGTAALGAFEVRPCPCYPDHFDPQTHWFD